MIYIDIYDNTDKRKQKQVNDDTISSDNIHTYIQTYINHGTYKSNY